MTPFANDKVRRVRDHILALEAVRLFGFVLCKEADFPARSVLDASHLFLLSSSNQRQVHFVYYLTDSVEDYCTLRISNSAANDDFSLQDWLNAMQRNDNSVSRFNLASYSGSYDDRLAALFAYLDSQLQHSRLAPILHGETWEHVSFDWTGLK